MALVAFLMSLAGCAGPESGDRQLVWGGPRNISMLPIIAGHQGYFTEVGLNVVFNFVQTGKIAMDAVVSGDLDFGIIVETNIAFVEFQEGADIRVVSAIVEKYDDAIIARTDMGITRPEDLEGKTVGVVRGTTSHRFLDLFIEHHDLDRSSIEILNLTPPSIQASLLNGSIDAGSIWQPQRYNVKQALGDTAIQFNDRAIYKAYSLVAVRGPLLRERPELVVSFLRALVMAEDFVRENLDEAIEILSAEINIEPQTLRAVWDEYDPRVRLDLGLRGTLLEQGEWIKRTMDGFESFDVPAYDSVLAPEFLYQLDSTRVIGGGP